MVLPVTISGLRTSMACVGPFKSSGGNFYFFGADTSAALHAYKATDPTSSFSSIASKASFFGTNNNADDKIAGYQQGDIIHVVSNSSNGTTNDIKYVQFDMSSDGFGSTENIATGLDTATNGGLTQYGVSVVVRSGGEAVALFSGENVANMGQSYAQVYWSRRTGVNTWTGAAQVSAGGQINVLDPEAILGVSDAVHFIFRDSGSSNIRQRTLSSGNTLQTAGSASAIFSGNNGSPNSGVSYDDAGTTRVVFTRSLDTANTRSNIYFDSGNTPTLNTNGDTATGTSWGPRLFVDTGDSNKVWVLYIGGTTQDLYVQNSTDNGASFTGDTQVFTATVAPAETSLSHDGNIYQRGSSVVIPYVVNDNGTLKYNEYVVRSSSTAWAGTAAPSIALAVAATAALRMAATSAMPVGFDLLANAEIKPLRGTAVLAAELSIAANATRVTTGNAAPSIVTNLAANALRFSPVTAALSVSADLVATPSMRQAAASTQSVTLSMAAAALRFTNATAAPQISFSLSAATIQMLNSIAMLPAELNMLANPVQHMAARASLPITFDMIANATIPGQVAQITASLAVALSLSANAVRYSPVSSTLAVSIDAIANAVRYSPIATVAPIELNLSASATRLLAGLASLPVGLNVLANPVQVMAASATLPLVLSMAANALRFSPVASAPSAVFDLRASTVQRLAATAVLPVAFDVLASPVQRMRAQATASINFGMEAFATIAGQVVAWPGTAVMAVSLAIQAQAQQVMAALSTQEATFAIQATASMLEQAQAQAATVVNLSASASLMLDARASAAVTTAMQVDAKARLAAYAGAMVELSMDAHIVQISSMSSIAVAEFDIRALAALHMPALATASIDFNLFADADIKFISPIQSITVLRGIADRTQGIDGVARTGQTIKGVARRADEL